MATFNFSNMQGEQKEKQYVPSEFRGAVENAQKVPVGSYHEPSMWEGVKNFFTPANTDTGFIDETGTWNSGTPQEMQKYNQGEKAFNNSIAGQIVNSNAYKKYFYSKDDVLLEAKKISAATHIPENAILASSENLDNARNIYNYQQRAMDPEAVFKAYPELSELAKKSDTDAAIALHNLRNVRQTQGIIEAAKTGWELDNLMSERGRMGYEAMNGKELTEENLKRLEEIAKRQKEIKELPSLFEDPAGAIIGGTVQSGKMMLRNALNGQKMGVYGAGFGAILGGAIGGVTTLGAGTAPGAIAGAKVGYSIGSRIGMAQDMYDEIAGNNYLDYKNYKDKNGRQLLTDNQARAYAAAAAGIETAIEFSNTDGILRIVKGGAGAQGLRDIVKSATNSTELQSMLADYVKTGAKNVGTVAASESLEEGVQEMSNRIISNVMAANNPGGDIPTYSAKDILVGGIEASWQALPASIGFGVGAHSASTVSFLRRASAALELKGEERKANMQNANGFAMLKNLAEDIKTNELFKKAPEVYGEVLRNQLKGTDLETVSIDTEFVLNQTGGYELLKTAAQAAGIGEQYLKDIIDTKADLKIDTATYAEKFLPNDIGARLEDYITFSEMGECLARNREYAGRMRREMDRVLAFEERQREDALNTFLEQNFPNPENREVAEAVLRRFPDNPKEGVKEIRKSLQAKIDDPLNEIITELEKGMGNGTSVIEYEEYDGQMRGRGVRVSNNDVWYQNYWKINKKKPSKKELRDIAYDIYTGNNEYGLLGWENNTQEEEQWYANNKASIEATEEAIRRLDALTPALEKIDPGELSITEGLSEEGFEVYRKLRGQLEGAESKEVRQAAQMSAILAARMADRMAEWHRKAGQTKYTALNYARSIGLIGSEAEADAQKFNQAAMRQENKRYVLNKDGNIDWGSVNELVADDGTKIKKAPVRMQIGYQVGESDAGAGYIHILRRHDKFIKNKGYESIAQAVNDVLERTDFITVEKSRNGAERLELFLDLTPRTSFMLAMDYTEDETGAYYSIVSLMPRSKKQLRDKKTKALSFDGSVRPSSATGSGAFFTPTGIKAGTKGDSIAGKDNTFDTVSLADVAKSVNEYTYDQKAYHGTPYNFEMFDVGKIGDGVGDQVHGWGLYFAQDRKISENYKEVLSINSGAVTINGQKYTMDDEGEWWSGRDNKHWGEQVKYGEPLSYVLEAMDQAKNKADAIKNIQERIDGTKKTANTEKYISNLQEAIKILSESDVAYENPSRLLEVEIPENDVMLDEQKKYYDQSGKVQESLNNMFEDLFANGSWTDNIYANHKMYINDLDNFDNLSGRGIYELLSAGFDSDKQASLKLKEYGIEGITYVGGKDGRCFVVFDDKAVDIIERYNQSAGQYAMTANMEKLNEAKEMYAKAEAAEEEPDMEAIYQKTGWHLGADGKWRFEIPDNLDKIDAAKFPEEGYAIPLGEIYNNPKLYKAYPWLADVIVQSEPLDDTTLGMATSEDYIVLNSNMLEDGILQEISINGIKYKRKVSKDGTKTGKFFSSGDEFVEYALNHGIKKGAFDKTEAINSLEELAQEKESIINKLRNKNSDGRFDKGLSVKNKELEKIREAADFIKRADISFEEIKKADRDIKAAHNKLAGTLIHEVQHIIQNNEGFASGGNAEHVSQAMQRQFEAYEQRIKRIHPDGLRYLNLANQYSEETLNNILGLTSDEELAAIKENLENVKKGITSENIAKLEQINRLRVELGQRLNSPLSDYEKYRNLHGEQEARAASEKAKIATELARLQETSYNDLLKEYALSDAEQQDAERYISLRKEAIEKVAAGEEVPEEIFDAIADIEDNPSNSEAFNNFIAALDKKIWDEETLEMQLQEKELNSVNPQSAIIVFNGTSYSMDTQQGLWQLKGQTAFKTTGEKVISLFKAADQSTFLHEMAHVYYHDMLALAKLPNAPEQLLKDIETINKWAAWDEQQYLKEYKGTAMEREFKKLNEQMYTAVKNGSVEIDGKTLTLEQMQRLWMQERFARGFENYLKEGKAPSEATRSIFRRFKQWLSQIYRAFSQIGGSPSKEVKAVMDRMIASEDEIDIAMKKKGVDDFAKDGGMDYLADSTKQVYMNMVERAKADAEEKVLKIALKDVKEEHRKQEEEFFAQEEAEYREKLAAEPVFVIAEHLKNNPTLSVSSVCETLGMSVEDYVAKLKEYGGSLDIAVQRHMKEFKKNIDNSGFDAQYFRERAEEVVQENKYRKLVTAMELNAFENIAKKQRNIAVTVEAEQKNTPEEKSTIKTVDKMTKQSKKIEELTAETKGLKQDKRDLLTNVRGLRDAALRHYKEYVQFVEMKLETMPITEANNYQMWRRKSAQAQYNSEQSLIKGEWEKAIRHKQAQLIYDMFADHAVRNAKQVKKIEDGLKRKQQTITKAKNISANERYAFNHLMYVFGFSDVDAPQPPHYDGIMDVLMKADATREEGGLMLESPFFTPDGQTNLPEWFLQAAMNSNKRKAGHSDLSNMQVDLVAQVMHIIYKRGMDDMKLATIKTKDGKVITIDEAVAEIEGQVRQRMVERANADPTGANQNTWQDDAANFIDQADKVLIKPEIELKKMGDVAVRYIYDPLKEAADKELKMSVNMQDKLKGLFGVYSAEELNAMRTKRVYQFGSSLITKEQAIMIALNWGTETNQKRVLDGYHVNIVQVKNVLKHLDERDWNLVNNIWKLYDIHWDQVREIEARITGAVLQKQEAKGFVVISEDQKIYTLDGGYFPIKYDLRDLRTQEQQADAAAQQSAMSNIAMSLGKGFLKERTQNKVERRLDLSFDVISGSITDVIHLVAFREPVRDVRRIVLNDNFKNLVYNYLGQNTYKNIKKWTADCWAEEPVPRTAYEKAMANLRNAQTMGTMGFRATTALLNIANVPSVAHYMGAVGMLHALKKFYSAPRQYADFVFQRSVFMAERAETMDASIRDAIKGPSVIDKMPGMGKASDAIKNNAFKMITWTDLMLALPLWQHEYEKVYNKEVEAGRSPQQARESGVNAGDAAVRWCFGSGRTVDKAAIQRKSGELMKQLTMYYSYNSTVYNALNYKIWEAKVGYKKAVAESAKNKNLALMKAVAHAGDALLMWVLLPAVISAILRAGASGDDDDWKIEKLLKSTGKETLTGIVGGIPVLRDAVPYLMAKVFDEKQYAPKIPVQNTIDQTNRVIQSIVSDKKTISDTVREMGKLTSQLTGAPSTLIDSFATTLQYFENGLDDSIADYLRALIFDKKLKKK